MSGEPAGSRVSTLAALRDTLLLGWRVALPMLSPLRGVVVEEVPLALPSAFAPGPPTPPPGPTAAPTPSTPLSLRSYATASSRYPVIVLHGLTRQGFDDHRLVRFCRCLAATGFVAYTPDLTGLRGLDLDESDIGRISETVRIAHERHGARVGVIGFSVGATYGLIASADARARSLVAYTLAAGAYYSLETLLGTVFARQATDAYAVLAMDWRCLDTLGLSPAEETAYRNIMDRYCQREGHFSAAEDALIERITASPAQADVRRWWEERLAGKRALQLDGTAYLGEIEAEVLLLCSGNDPLIPPSETARIAGALRSGDVWVQRSAGHVDYRNEQMPGLFRLFFRIMTLRQEAVGA